LRRVYFHVSAISLLTTIHFLAHIQTLDAAKECFNYSYSCYFSSNHDYSILHLQLINSSSLLTSIADGIAAA